MDTHPHPDGEMTDLERRLGAWRPDDDGLDPAAMLFAAGQAAGFSRRARFVWPVVCASLAILAASLGTWAASERAERLALARRLQQAPPTSPAPVPVPPPEPVVPSEPESPLPLVQDTPPAHSFLAFHRMLEQGLDAWPAAASVPLKSPPESPRPPVFRAWPHDESLAP